MLLFIALMVGSERLYSIGKLFEPYGYMPILPENQHVTLVFIGDADSYRSYLLKQKLSRIVVRHSRFIEIKELELLPPQKATNVVTTVRIPNDVMKLRELLLKEIRNVIEPKDKYSFYPHVTIARRPRPIPEDLIDGVIETMEKARGKLPRVLHVKGLALVYSRAGRYKVELWLSEPLVSER